MILEMMLIQLSALWAQMVIMKHFGDLILV